MPAEVPGADVPLDPNENARDDAIGFGVVGAGQIFVGHNYGIRHAGEGLVAYTTDNAKKQSGDFRGVDLNLGLDGQLLDVSNVDVVSNDDADQLINNPRVDAVIVASTTETHKQIAMQAIAEGKPVLVEKPLAATSADAQEIVDAATAADVKIAVGTELPSIGPFAILIKRLKERGLDNVKRINMQRQLPWKVTDNEDATKACHGWALDLGVHDLGLLRSALGDAESIEAEDGAERYGDLQFVKIKLNYPGSDAVVVCEVGAKPEWDAEEGFHHSFEVEFNDGIKLTFNANGDNKLEEFDGTKNKTVPVTRTMQETFGEEIRVVTDYFKGKRPDAGHFDAQHHVDTLSVLEKAKESDAQAGKPVMLA